MFEALYFIYDTISSFLVVLNGLEFRLSIGSDFFTLTYAHILLFFIVVSMCITVFWKGARG